tara:strand:+ start:164039 stop:164539 length:501 start_codon:yes stop_codon:yes gene_type:complete
VSGATVTGKMKGWATFSECEQYRYTLGRRWDAGGKRVCFCLLNPSTADAEVLDPTLTRCHRYAVRWGFSAMDVVNIFALRSTDPKGLKLVDDPIGEENDRHIARLAKGADLVVAGWGTHGKLMGRGDAVRGLLTKVCIPHCLDVTMHGFPKHPLYLRGDLEPRVFG